MTTLLSSSRFFFIQARTGFEEPLLQDECEDEQLLELIDEDDADDCAQYFCSSTANSSDTCFTVCDHVCLLFILPGLLSIQFGMAKLENHGLNFVSILLVIGLFVITSYMYKLSIYDMMGQYYGYGCFSVLQLLPEVIMDIVLGLILLLSADIAFQFLLISTLLLSFIVIVTTIQILFFNSNDNTNKTIIVDEMDLSEKGDGCLRYFV